MDQQSSTLLSAVKQLHTLRKLVVAMSSAAPVDSDDDSACARCSYQALALLESNSRLQSASFQIQIGSRRTRKRVVFGREHPPTVIEGWDLAEWKYFELAG